MSAPKRHHYLPRFYLQGFCRGTALWVFDRKLGEFREQTPANTAVEARFYAAVNEDGTLDNQIEDTISRIEAYAAPIILRADRRAPLNGEDKFILSVFAALLRTRVPDFAKQQEDLRRAVLKKIGPLGDRTSHKRGGKPKRPQSVSGEQGYDAAEVVTHLEALESDPDASHNDFLQMIIPITRELSKHLLNMDWLVAHPPPDSHFVTSDNPFVVTPPPDHDPGGHLGVGIATPGAGKIVPLTARTCLIILDTGSALVHARLPRREVNSLNSAIAASCDRYLIASDEGHLRHLVKTTNLDQIPYVHHAHVL